ncbi:MAG: DUF4097 family beta strand repeat protein [Lachnospiraceae bacterium]|nr:DUF4097 family beta strand repeat protein [Lachnospiraceae bacterium]
MNGIQKVIKYCAMAFAVFLSVSIFGSIAVAVISLVSASALKDGFYGENRITLSERYSATEIEELGIERIFVECNAEIIVRQGDELSIEAQNVPEDYRLRCNNGTLHLYSTRKNFFLFLFGIGSRSEREKVTVTVPEWYTPKEVKIDSGSGSVSITELHAERLDMDTGSGKVNVANVFAKETIIDSGSGRITAENSELGRLQLDSGSGAVGFQNVKAENVNVDSGSGKIQWEGELTGNCNFETGSGSVSLQLAGSESEYRIKVSSGSGGVRVNGRKTDDGSYGTNVRGELRIDSGSGAVNVKFDED